MDIINFYYCRSDIGVEEIQRSNGHYKFLLL